LGTEQVSKGLSGGLYNRGEEREKKRYRRQGTEEYVREGSRRVWQQNK
jgi:hypothetical protein